MKTKIAFALAFILLGCQPKEVEVSGQIIVQGRPIAGATVFSCDIDPRLLKVPGGFSDPATQEEYLSPALERGLETAVKFCHSRSLSSADGTFRVKQGELLYVIVNQPGLLGYWLVDTGDQADSIDLTEANTEKLLLK